MSEDSKDSGEVIGLSIIIGLISIIIFGVVTFITSDDGVESLSMKCDECLKKDHNIANEEKITMIDSLQRYSAVYLPDGLKCDSMFIPRNFLDAVFANKNNIAINFVFGVEGNKLGFILHPVKCKDDQLVGDTSLVASIFGTSFNVLASFPIDKYNAYLSHKAFKNDTIKYEFFSSTFFADSTNTNLIGYALNLGLEQSAWRHKTAILSPVLEIRNSGTGRIAREINTSRIMQSAWPCPKYCL